MKFSDSVKPISYLKANAAKILKEIAAKHQPVIITQNGEAKAIIQDIRDYEETQEALVLLKILAMGEKNIENGNVIDAEVAHKNIKKMIAEDEI